MPLLLLPFSKSRGGQPHAQEKLPELRANGIAKGLHRPRTEASEAREFILVELRSVRYAGYERVRAAVETEAPVIDLIRLLVARIRRRVALRLTKHIDDCLFGFCPDIDRGNGVSEARLGRQPQCRPHAAGQLEWVRLMFLVWPTRALTIRLIRAIGRGWFAGNWMVPLETVRPLSSPWKASMTEALGNRL